MLYDVSHDTLTHPQKTWICQKLFVLFCQFNLYVQTLSGFLLGEDEECVPVELMQICKAK